ncbi:hypothetical protein LXJ15735_18550 [Lacrimispora xylanolytica]
MKTDSTTDSTSFLSILYHFSRNKKHTSSNYTSKCAFEQMIFIGDLQNLILLHKWKTWVWSYN